MRDGSFKIGKVNRKQNCMLTNLDIHRNLMVPLNEGGEYHEKIIKLDEESVYISFEKSARQYLSVTSII